MDYILLSQMQHVYGFIRNRVISAARANIRARTALAIQPPAPVIPEARDFSSFVNQLQAINTCMKQYSRVLSDALAEVHYVDYTDIQAMQLRKQTNLEERLRKQRETEIITQKSHLTAVNTWLSENTTEFHEWCIATGQEIEYTTAICNYMMKQGATDVLKSAYAAGYRSNDIGCAEAASAGYVGALKFVRETGQKWNDRMIMNVACAAGHTRVVSYLIRLDVKFNQSDAILAAKNGHEHLFRRIWLFGEKIDWATVHDAALAAGHTEAAASAASYI